LSVGYQKEILQADKSIKGKSSGLPFMLEKSGSVLSGFDGNSLMQSLAGLYRRDGFLKGAVKIYL
jgi:hypothetical protein